MPARRLTTYQYLATPETALPQELVWGVLRDAAAPSARHQWTLVRLLLALVRHVDERGLGTVLPSPIDVVLDGERGLIVQPDLVVISRERDEIVTDRVWGAPDLAVEILSPHPRIGRLDERLEWFARYGVRECWLIHQIEREVEVLGFEAGTIGRCRRCASDSPITSVVLPDFDSSLDTILRGRGDGSGY